MAQNAVLFVAVILALCLSVGRSVPLQRTTLRTVIAQHIDNGTAADILANALLEALHDERTQQETKSDLSTPAAAISYVADASTPKIVSVANKIIEESSTDDLKAAVEQLSKMEAKQKLVSIEIVKLDEKSSRHQELAARTVDEQPQQTSKKRTRKIRRRKIVSKNGVARGADGAANVPSNSEAVLPASNTTDYPGSIATNEETTSAPTITTDATVVTTIEDTTHTPTTEKKHLSEKTSSSGVLDSAEASTSFVSAASGVVHDADSIASIDTIDQATSVSIDQEDPRIIDAIQTNLSSTSVMDRAPNVSSLVKTIGTQVNNITKIARSNETLPQDEAQVSPLTTEETPSLLPAVQAPSATSELRTVFLRRPSETQSVPVLSHSRKVAAVDLSHVHLYPKVPVLTGAHRVAVDIGGLRYTQALRRIKFKVPKNNIQNVVVPSGYSLLRDETVAAASPSVSHDEFTFVRELTTVPAVPTTEATTPGYEGSISIRTPEDTKHITPAPSPTTTTTTTTTTASERSATVTVSPGRAQVTSSEGITSDETDSTEESNTTTPAATTTTITTTTDATITSLATNPAIELEVATPMPDVAETTSEDVGIRAIRTSTQSTARLSSSSPNHQTVPDTQVETDHSNTEANDIRIQHVATYDGPNPDRVTGVGTSIRVPSEPHDSADSAETTTPFTDTLTRRGLPAELDRTTTDQHLTNLAESDSVESENSQSSPPSGQSIDSPLPDSNTDHEAALGEHSMRNDSRVPMDYVEPVVQTNVPLSKASLAAAEHANRTYLQEEAAAGLQSNETSTTAVEYLADGQSVKTTGHLRVALSAEPGGNESLGAQSEKQSALQNTEDALTRHQHTRQPIVPSQLESLSSTAKRSQDTVPITNEEAIEEQRDHEVSTVKAATARIGHADTQYVEANTGFAESPPSEQTSAEPLEKLHGEFVQIEEVQRDNTAKIASASLFAQNSTAINDSVAEVSRQQTPPAEVLSVEGSPKLSSAKDLLTSARTPAQAVLESTVQLQGQGGETSSLAAEEDEDDLEEFEDYIDDDSESLNEDESYIEVGDSADNTSTKVVSDQPSRDVEERVILEGTTEKILNDQGRTAIAGPNDTSGEAPDDKLNALISEPKSITKQPKMQLLDQVNVPVMPFGGSRFAALSFEKQSNGEMRMILNNVIAIVRQEMMPAETPRSAEDTEQDVENFPDPGESVPGPDESVPGPDESVLGPGENVSGPGGENAPDPGKSAPGPGQSAPDYQEADNTAKQKERILVPHPPILSQPKEADQFSSRNNVTLITEAKTHEDGSVIMPEAPTIIMQVPPPATSVARFALRRIPAHINVPSVYEILDPEAARNSVGGRNVAGRAIVTLPLLPLRAIPPIQQNYYRYSNGQLLPSITVDSHRYAAPPYEPHLLGQRRNIYPRQQPQTQSAYTPIYERIPPHSLATRQGSIFYIN